ncbi:ATP-binding protein [Pseudomonas eucalypticola]|uniref:histidine kinase n=1 Tax=Pseudomonas eucalypticola TaxID=2599595 RepID=A0A7D5D8Q2_9PSED|nr:ATP-binding protein [Pseudomonas eucalypticola]QKZ05733.1 response regulator [Pseudomonas eucalypticola]
MPEYNYRLIRKLATTSLRLNTVLLCAVFLNLLMLAACTWALSRVVSEERNKVSLHFNRLMGDIRQHEDFLTQIAQHGDHAPSRQPAQGLQTQHALVAETSDARVYEGRQFTFSMPFTLAQQHARNEPNPGNFTLGMLLATFYSSFWSTSAYPAPQLLVMGAQGNTSLAVPALGHFAGRPPLTLGSYLPTVAQIHAGLQTQAPSAVNQGVSWGRSHTPGELLGYIAFKLPDALWWAPDLKRRVVAVTLLDLERLNNPEQVWERPLYDQLQLQSPRGNSLMDAVGRADDYAQGLNFAAQGIVFKVGGAAAGGWVALYQLGYQHFFGYAKWQLLGGALLLLMSLFGSWAATRWYSRKVVWPARQANQMVAEAKRSADAASAAKSRFLATMSHEIRTPLYGALGTLELLGRSALNPRQHHHLKVVEQSCTTLLHLVSDALDVSKIEAGEMTLAYAAFDPHALAEEVVAGYAGMAKGRGVHLQLRVDDNVPGLVQGDVLRTRQVLNNLISNGLKFTEAGSVALQVKADVVADSAVLHWQVTDTGVGIAPEQQRRLFEPFYQAHAPEHTISGTGLGLSICASLASLMGGRLQVASQPGVGSTFTFSVTQAVLNRQRPLAAPGASEGDTFTPLGLRVLVAEDNPLNRALLQEQLQTLGCRVTLAENGRVALAQWAPGAFDVLLTDVNMPLMTGYQLANELRRQGAALPMVGLTAGTGHEGTALVAAAGMDAWLVKPVSLGDLHQLLLRLCPPGDGSMPAPVPSAPPVDRVELSPALRALFDHTLRADIQVLRDAALRLDRVALGQQLHRLCGALAVVKAHALSQACEALERQLAQWPEQQPLPPAFAVLVERIERLLVKAPGDGTPGANGEPTPSITGNGFESHE